VPTEDDDRGTQTCVQSRSAQLRFTTPAAGFYTVRATTYEIAANNNDTIDLNAEGDSTLTTVGGTAPIVRQGTLEGETHPYDDSSCAWTRARLSRSP
jgi:hypothetical protein